MSDTCECLQCNDLFKRVDGSRELFCDNECRIKFWKSKSKKGTTEDHLEDLKLTMERTMAEGRSMRKHLDRLLHDYSDWEDRVVAVEKRLYDLEIEVGIEEKELNNHIFSKNNQDINFDALDEL